jgi:hypothetical protein
LLIPHCEREPDGSVTRECYQLLEPERVAFISYPYEWCCSQLRDAALATLTIQKRALARGMTLKDASAYNIQVRGGKPVLIDTLSFERYREGAPWISRDGSSRDARGSACRSSFTCTCTPGRRRSTTVAGYLERPAPATVWDLGANTGMFSRLASLGGAATLSLDSDHDALEDSQRVLYLMQART